MREYDEDAELAEIESRCQNWKRCYQDIAPQASSSIQKVIDALIKKRGKPQEESVYKENTHPHYPKDIKDAEVLEYVWVHLATDDDRTFWQEKAIIRCGVFLSVLPVSKLCKICKIKRQKDWPDLYRRAMLFFAMRVRVYDQVKNHNPESKKHDRVNQESKANQAEKYRI